MTGRWCCFSPSRLSCAVLLLLLATFFGCGDGKTGLLGNKPEFTASATGIVDVSSCSVAWGDYDNDGDLDLAVAGAGHDPSGTGWTQYTKIYRNDDGRFFDIEADLVGVGSSALAWGDYDADSDLDLAVSGSGEGGTKSTRVYRNDGNGVFTDINAGLPGVCWSALTWGDVDNDGDLDLALSGAIDMYSSLADVFINNNGNFTPAGSSLLDACEGSLAWGDFDNDGDLDLALSGYNAGPNSLVYQNDGGVLNNWTSANITAVYYSSMAWGDYDGDGDLDLVVAGMHDFGEYYTDIYRNEGYYIGAAGAGLPNTCGCSLAWGDYDNDGDFDLALAGAAIKASVFRNDGGNFIDTHPLMQGVNQCSSAWGDYDNDGDLDLFVAGLNYYGDLSVLYINNCGKPNNPPFPPSGLQSSVSGSDVTLSWNAAFDEETPVSSLTYNVKVRRAFGGPDDIMPCHSDPVTGWRRIPAMGNVQLNKSWTLKGLAPGMYYWSVQAVDSGFTGSAWALEESFIIP